jgi:polysaccharide pyruvyl transferase WcaK-like protein
MRNTIALFNLKYSQNLGDGVIALCLEHELRRHFPLWDVRSIDLAGRSEWATSKGGTTRASLLRLLDQLPAWAGEAAVQAALGVELQRRLLQFYREGVDGCRFAIFGGGQLFQDGDLNFPLKLAAAAKICSAAAVPFGVYAVGAAESRSRTGRRLFRRVLTACQPDVVFARDAASASRLLDLGAISAKVCLDPGILASELWPTAASGMRRQAVGLCITHPAVLSHHGGAVGGSSQAFMDRVVALIERLTAENYSLVCFTDGANEDELFLTRCRDRLRNSGLAGNRIVFAPRCGNPAELARLVSSFDAVIAHRLHACILAYSYKIPAIGLLWDPKLDAFFEAVGQSHHVVDLERASDESMVDRVAAALATPISPTRHAAVLESARLSVYEMANGIGNALGALVTPLPLRNHTGREEGAVA